MNIKHFFAGILAFLLTLVVMLYTCPAIAQTTPHIDTIQPNSTPPVQTDLTITVNGSNFECGCVVMLNDIKLKTKRISSTQLTAVIPKSQLATPAVDNVVVVNRSWVYCVWYYLSLAGYSTPAFMYM